MHKLVGYTWCVTLTKPEKRGDVSKVALYTNREGRGTPTISLDFDDEARAWIVKNALARAIENCKLEPHNAVAAARIARFATG